MNSPARRRLALGLLVLALLTAWAFFQGDLLEESDDIRAFFVAIFARFGFTASLLLLYAEESGVPLPLPGDAILIYLGGQGHLWWSILLVVVAVCAGASNLYWLSRRWGPRLLASPTFAAILHLTPARVERARAWFARWGPATVIFGRHVPGLRIPITFVAGSLGLPYRVFLPSLAVSAALWATLWLTLAARFAPRLEAFAAAHTWLYALLLLAALVALLFPLLSSSASRQSH